MNRNVMIVLAGGFLIAILVAMLVKASLSGGGSQDVASVEQEERVKIIVAAKDLAIGAELSEENMKWQDWPESAVFPGAVVQEEDKKTSETMSGRLRRGVKAGEPILKSALVDDTDGNFLAASLSEGMRAVAVDVEASSMVGGFVGPGDYVDVLLTYKASIKYEGPENPEVDKVININHDKYATETVLENVKVLAVDQKASMQEGEEDEKVKVGKTVTLEVDYRGAEVLALASSVGEIRLTLRRLGDDKIMMERPPVITDARLTHIYDEVMGEISKMTGQSIRIVRIYRGGEVEEIAVTK